MVADVADAVTIIIEAMKTHAGVVPVQVAALAFMYSLSFDRKCAQVLGERGAVAATLAAMDAVAVVDVQKRACDAIWNLTFHVPNRVRSSLGAWLATCVPHLPC